MSRLRLAIADDHQLYAEALEMLLGGNEQLPLDVVGTFFNGADLLDFMESNPVDVVLLDLNMPVVDGLTALPKIKAEYPRTRVIVVTLYDDAKFIKQVMNKFRGDAYFLKTNPFNELLEAIEAVMTGDIFLSAGLKVFPKDIIANGDQFYEDEFQLRHRLTPRETQILQMISLAKSNKEIAEELFISDQTVMVHRKNIMRKLNVSNTAGLIKFALDHDLT